MLFRRNPGRPANERVNVCSCSAILLSHTFIPNARQQLLNAGMWHYDEKWNELYSLSTHISIKMVYRNFFACNWWPTSIGRVIDGHLVPKHQGPALNCSWALFPIPLTYANDRASIWKTLAHFVAFPMAVSNSVIKNEWGKGTIGRKNRLGQQNELVLHYIQFEIQFPCDLNAAVPMTIQRRSVSDRENCNFEQYTIVRWYYILLVSFCLDEVTNLRAISELDDSAR